MGVVMKNPDLLLCTPWLVEENTSPRVESHRESDSNGYWKSPCSNPFGIPVIVPICPDDPVPQHASLPFDRVAQVWVSPADTDRARVPPGIKACVGPSDVVDVPVPTWPSMFLPQHQTSPSAPTAQA